MKRAGEAGKALRASVLLRIYFRKPERVAAPRGFASVSVGDAEAFEGMAGF